MPIDPTTIARLQTALETGSFVTVVYNGGHVPGFKRRILPRRITDRLVYALEPPATTIKTYRLDLLSHCDAGDEIPWATEARTKRLRYSLIDPEQYFATWEYSIASYFWPIFGIALREYVDQDATTRARQLATRNGATVREIRAIKVRRLRYSVPPDPPLDFHEGDLFYSVRLAPLQVIASKEFLEVHRLTNGAFPRQAFHLTSGDLAHWLQFGEIPTSLRIHRLASYSMILRSSIEPPGM